MHSRLDSIGDWENRAKASGYSASKTAKMLGVTLRLLESFFQARFGVAPHEWMVGVRMTHAAGMLTRGVPVKIVSGEVGYKQVSHFSREFKRFFGTSPSSYVVVDVSAAKLGDLNTLTPALSQTRERE